MANRNTQEALAGALDNVIALPLRQTSLLASTMRDCNSLRQGIVTMQQCLRALGDLVQNLDDRPEDCRELLNFLKGFRGGWI